MSTTFRPPTGDDLDAMADLAALCQVDPEQHSIYLGMSSESIAADIAELDRWTETAIVAERNGKLIGWLLAEIDEGMGRLWWWGPFATQDWAEVSDCLLAEVRAVIGTNIAADLNEEEACADDRSVSMRSWCTRHGLVPETASVLLRRERGSASLDRRVRPLGISTTERDAVKALHDLAFPGTHSTPEALVASSEPRLVLEVEGEIVGYVAYEVQSDGSGYVDYLAVAESQRGNGLGGALVDHACQLMFESGVTYAHLTVREDNVPARALYTRLGFVEERLARPFRLGFQLD